MKLSGGTRVEKQNGGSGTGVKWGGGARRKGQENGSGNVAPNVQGTRTTTDDSTACTLAREKRLTILKWIVATRRVGKFLEFTSSGSLESRQHMEYWEYS